MPNLAFTVKVSRVLDDFLSKVEVHVDIKVRHGNAFRVKESFEDQLEAERINVRDTHGIGDKGTCSGTTTWTNRNVVFWLVVDVVIKGF